jgi:4'-phosphopantetheinyl transferase
MTKDRSRLSLTVRDAVANAPGTLRALAREAGVPHTTLVRVGKGEIEATPALAESLANVFERWGEVCKLYGFRVRQELYRAERQGQTEYSARRGGHAPPALRDAFGAWAQSRSEDPAAANDRGSLETSLDVAGRAVSVEWLLGQLWNCADVVPPSECDALSIPRGSTYARAVRTVKRSVNKRRASAHPRVPAGGHRADPISDAGETALDPVFSPFPETSISRPSLAEGEVHLWSVSLAVDDDVARAVERCLSDEERRQIARLRFARQRRARGVSRGLLRYLLAVYVGLPAVELRFRDGPYGKPELVPLAAGTERRGEGNLGFNLSHSADLMLIAVAPTRRVGVDVEQVRPIDQGERIVRRYFSAREQGSIAGAPEGRATEIFLRAWTRKEAVAKAMGEGIVRSLSRLEVTAAPDVPARLLAIDGDQRRAADWSLFHLNPAEGYTGALAIEGRTWRVSAWNAEVSQFLHGASESI